MLSNKCKEFITKVFGPVSDGYEVIRTKDLPKNVAGMYNTATPGKVYINTSLGVIDSTLVHELTHLSQWEYNAGFIIPFYKMKEIMAINNSRRESLDFRDYYRKSPIEVDAILCQIYFYWTHNNCFTSRVGSVLKEFDTETILLVLNCAEDYLVEKEFYEMIYSQLGVEIIEKETA